MTDNKLLLVHMAGYATIATILGTANWSWIGWVFALPIAAATVVFAGWMLYRALLTRAKRELPRVGSEVSTDD